MKDKNNIKYYLECLIVRYCTDLHPWGVFASGDENWDDVRDVLQGFRRLTRNHDAMRGFRRLTKNQRCNVLRFCE